MKNSQRHRAINKLKTFFKDIGLPFTAHFPTDPVPAATRFPGCWLEPGGLHFHQGNKRLSPGRLCHEAGHWALLAPADRLRVQPGCLDEQGLETCGTDIAVEGWVGAAALAAGIPVEWMFTDLEDYGDRIGGEPIWDEYSLGLFLGCQILQGEHHGAGLLKVLKMTSEYPKMARWFAEDWTVALWEEFQQGARQYAVQRALSLPQ